jgi:hypothetical protein
MFSLLFFKFQITYAADLLAPSTKACQKLSRLQSLLLFSGVGFSVSLFSTGFLGLPLGLPLRSRVTSFFNRALRGL